MTAQGMILLGFLCALGCVVLYMATMFLACLWLRLATPYPARRTITATVDVSINATARLQPGSDSHWRKP